MSEQSKASRTREINEMVRYTMWSVFRLDEPLGPDDGGADRAAEATEVTELFDKLGADDRMQDEAPMDDDDNDDVTQDDVGVMTRQDIHT